MALPAHPDAGSPMGINPSALIAFVRGKAVWFAACSGERRGAAQPLLGMALPRGGLQEGLDPPGKRKIPKPRVKREG